ncbi:MAG: hypothetical protein K0R49_1128 [Burkholderiales bacterium]|jgi:uncharacterized protein (TIGR00290 family)|nr:hypothetical protein [Burkholderiales bacterium]
MGQFSKVAVSWSGGKDCCLALNEANNNGLQPVVLLCMMDPDRDYSRSNGVSKQILEMQAKSLQLPIYFVPSDWDQYKDNIIKALTKLKNTYQIEGCIFGDIDIEGHRMFEESICNETGIIAYLPLWGIERSTIKNKMIRLGIKSKLSVISKSFNIAEFIAYDYHMLDFSKLKDLGVDICGENGEFHTVVYSAPLFKSLIHLEVQTIYDLKSVLLCDFIATEISKPI